MATSFSAAALGAEGLAADVTMLVGNGYVPGHADYALSLLRGHAGRARPVRAAAVSDGNVTRILLRGGYVHTPADPHATALCIEDGTIVWTGDDDASVHFQDNADRVVELDGRLVTPAFVDAHAHLAQTGFAATGVDLTGVPSLAAALEALAAHARLTTSPVILGQGWDETTWPEGRAVHPRRARPRHRRAPGVRRPGRRALRGRQLRLPGRLPATSSTPRGTTRPGS